MRFLALLIIPLVLASMSVVIGEANAWCAGSAGLYYVGISGRIFDAITNKPLEGVHVADTRFKYSQNFTDPNGNYTLIIPLAPGTSRKATIEYTKDGYESERINLNLSGAVNPNGAKPKWVTVDVWLEPLNPPSVKESLVLIITLDAVTMLPVSNATIRIRGQEYLTDVNGTLRLTLPPGNYSIEAEHPEYLPASTSLSASIGSMSQLKIDLQPVRTTFATTQEAATGLDQNTTLLAAGLVYAILILAVFAIRKVRRRRSP